MFKKRMSTRFFVPGEIAMPDMPDMDMGGMGGMGMGMGDPMGFPNPALQGRPPGGSPERPRGQRPPGNRGPARQLIMPGLLEEPSGPVMPVVENETFEDPDFNPEYCKGSQFWTHYMANDKSRHSDRLGECNRCRGSRLSAKAPRL